MLIYFSMPMSLKYKLDIYHSEHYRMSQQADGLMR